VRHFKSWIVTYAFQELDRLYRHLQQGCRDERPRCIDCGEGNHKQAMGPRTGAADISHNGYRTY
jgi:hypothetical protein